MTHEIEIESLKNFAAADGLNLEQRALLAHVAKRLAAWDQQIATTENENPAPTPDAAPSVRDVINAERWNYSTDSAEDIALVKVLDALGASSIVASRGAREITWGDADRLSQQFAAYAIAVSNPIHDTASILDALRQVFPHGVAASPAVPSTQTLEGAFKRLLDRWAASEKDCREMAERLGERNPVYNELLRDASQYHQSAFGVRTILAEVAATHPTPASTSPAVSVDEVKRIVGEVENHAFATDDHEFISGWKEACDRITERLSAIAKDQT